MNTSLEPHAKKPVSPKDVFLHLLNIILLYAAVISFLTLIFQLTNLQFPDAAASQYDYRNEFSRDAIRWSLSMLIVIFPIFIWISWLLNKIYTKEPEKRNLKIRKWLTYLTLFISAGVIIVDLVTLVDRLLEGELTTRFLIKVAAVLFVTGAVFAYYLWDLKRHGAAD